MKKLFFASAITAVALAVARRPLPAAPEDLQQLFQTTKQQVRAGAYADALKTIDTLDAELAKPGRENDQKMGGPSLLFYRGVCQAALGRKEEARAAFRAFIGGNPNASIDRAMYPKAAVAAFDEAKKSVSGAPPHPASSLREQFAQFHPPPPPAGLEGEDWAKGPVQYLLTSDEKREWATLSEPRTRSEFITKFWASRDPDPMTPENEFRTEFEKRTAFADAALMQAEIRGSLTDRGMVFVLLGPPTYLTQRPITAEEDSADRRSVFTNKVLDTLNNTKETWQYLRELLPKGVPYQQVDFVFITRRGYGTNVMQRDSAPLVTLDAARKTNVAR